MALSSAWLADVSYRHYNTIRPVIRYLHYFSCFQKSAETLHSLRPLAILV
jgi:hypothetical protein